MCYVFVSPEPFLEDGSSFLEGVCVVIGKSLPLGNWVIYDVSLCCQPRVLEPAQQR